MAESVVSRNVYPSSPFLHTVFVDKTGLCYVNSLTCIVRYICSHATEEMTVAEEVVCFFPISQP